MRLACLWIKIINFKICLFLFSVERVALVVEDPKLKLSEKCVVVFQKYWCGSYRARGHNTYKGKFTWIRDGEYKFYLEFYAKFNNTSDNEPSCSTSCQIRKNNEYLATTSTPNRFGFAFAIVNNVSLTTGDEVYVSGCAGFNCMAIDTFLFEVEELYKRTWTLLSSVL